MVKMSRSATRVDIPGRAKRLLGLLLMLYLPCSATAAKLDPYQDFDETPELSLEDLGHSVQSLQDYRGQVVLVNFWASWCGPCVVEMPSLERLQQAMSGKPFTILAVNVGESHVKVWNFAAKLKIHLPLLLDPDGQAAADWQVNVYPSSFLVDPHGRVRYVAIGPRSWDAPEFIEVIEEMLDMPQPDSQQVK